MSDNFSILYPTGLVMDVGVVAPVNGTGNYGAVVVSPVLPGVRVQGTGQFSVTNLSGIRGTMRVSFVAGTAGASQVIAVLSQSGTNLMFGVILDTSNRPVALIRDLTGGAIGESAPLASAIPEGTPVEVIFAWDSTGVVVNGGFPAGVLISFGTESTVPGWTIEPPASWMPFVPDRLYVGRSPSGSLPFDGEIRVVQVSEVVEFSVPSTASIAEDLSASFVVEGESTLTGSAEMVFGSDAILAGVSDFAADADILPP